MKKNRSVNILKMVFFLSNYLLVIILNKLGLKNYFFVSSLKLEKKIKKNPNNSDGGSEIFIEYLVDFDRN